MSKLPNILKHLFRRKKDERDLDAEVRGYANLLEDENRAHGMNPLSARREANIALGGIEQVKEEVRSARPGAWLESLWRDFRFAARTLRKNPGFTAVAILTLALGIGANAAIFSVVNTVLLRPLPFANPEQLVRVSHVPPQKSFPGVKYFAVSPANFLDWKAQSQSFSAMSPYSFRSVDLTGVARPESILAGLVAPDFFSVVGVEPQFGRVFVSGDDKPGAPHVVVVSYSFWTTHLGADPQIIGKDLVLEHEKYSIAGVMPASFELSSWGITSAQIWTPLVWTGADRAIRGNHNYNVIARLKPGVTVAQAQAEMNAISARLAAAYPNEDTDWGAAVVPLQDFLVSGIRSSLLILLGAVAFVLLIACANIANLVLGRALSRGKEMAIRTALGAERSRLVRQSLSETLLLSLLGGAAGLGLASAAIAISKSVLANQVPRGADVSLDWNVFLFTLAISLLGGLIAGISPALRVSKADLSEVLKQGLGRSSCSAEPQRTRGMLIVSEVALSLMLLIGAGLMVRSLFALRAVNPGFEGDGMLTAAVMAHPQQYPQPAQRTAFFDETLRRIRAVPGVQAAAFVDSLPLTGGSMQPITIEGRAPGSAQDQEEIAVRECTPGYLAAMRIPLKRGRDFRDDDDRALLVSESMVKAYWPNQNPIGRRVNFIFDPGGPYHIVGVVGDVALQDLSKLQPEPTAYQFSRVHSWFGMSLVARTTGDPLALSRPVADALHSVDPEIPLQSVVTMPQILDQSLASQNFTMWLLAGFSGIALALAACGIYGVLSYAVRRRSREIGIRLAMGAQVTQILGMVLADAMKPVFIGIAIGLVGALSLGRVMQSLLFGVKPADLATLVLVSAVLGAVACFASFVPAMRASRLDPLQVLREE